MEQLNVDRVNYPPKRRERTVPMASAEPGTVSASENDQCPALDARQQCRIECIRRKTGMDARFPHLQQHQIE